MSKQDWKAEEESRIYQAGVTGRSGRRSDRKEWQAGVTGRSGRQE